MSEGLITAQKWVYWLRNENKLKYFVRSFWMRYCAKNTAEISPLNINWNWLKQKCGWLFFTHLFHDLFANFLYKFMTFGTILYMLWIGDSVWNMLPKSVFKTTSIYMSYGKKLQSIKLCTRIPKNCLFRFGWKLYQSLNACSRPYWNQSALGSTMTGFESFLKFYGRQFCSPLTYRPHFYSIERFKPFQDVYKNSRG